MKAYYKLYDGTRTQEYFTAEIEPGKKYILGRDPNSLLHQLLLVIEDNKGNREVKTLQKYNSAVSRIDEEIGKKGSLHIRNTGNDVTIYILSSITYPLLLRYNDIIVAPPLEKEVSIKNLIGDKGNDIIKLDIYINKISLNDKYKNYIGSIEVYNQDKKSNPYNTNTLFSFYR
jgi:hypothetical protein